MNHTIMIAGEENVQIQESMLESVSRKALKASAIFWFVVAVVGQWIFAYYVAVSYGSRTLYKGLESLSDTHLPRSYITPSDWIGNLYRNKEQN